MQIVINIPDKAYELLKNKSEFDNIAESIIANGIPLDRIRAEIEAQREEASNKHSEDDVLQAFYNGLNDGLKDARDTLDEYMVDGEVD